jgi:hypothetical protein
MGMLAQKIALELFEREAIGIANRSPMCGTMILPMSCTSLGGMLGANRRAREYGGRGGRVWWSGMTITVKISY